MSLTARESYGFERDRFDRKAKGWLSVTKYGEADGLSPHDV